MSDIIIKYKDELKCVLIVDRGIALEIKGEFSFYAKNYKNLHTYKFSSWDGKISLFNLKDFTFYVGLLSHLISWSKRRNYTISILPEHKELFKQESPYDSSFINEIDTFAHYTPKDYQVTYINEALRLKKALLLSPTGSGKSFIMYNIVRYILDNTDQKILINVPSINLVEQLFKDFRDYTKDDFDVATNVTRLYGGKVEDLNARVVISTWQTCQSRPPTYFKQFDAYLCDECHQANSKSLSTIIENLSHVNTRIGLTGTLDGTSLHELEMIARFGKVIKATSTAKLMDDGHLASLKVNFLKLKYSDEECKLISKKSTEYQQEIDYIIEHKMRNKLLINLALKQKSNTLMLFNFVDRHGMLLVDKLYDKADENLKKIHFIHGKIKGDEREIIREILDGDAPIWYDIEFDNGSMIRFDQNQQILTIDNKRKSCYNITSNDKINIEFLIDSFKTQYCIGTFDNNKIKSITRRIGTNILLGSFGTLAVGVNIKNLHTLIFCHPLKAKIRLLQSIGRILRACEGKESVKLIDIADDFSYMRGKTLRSNITLRHFYERLKIYESEMFDYTITEYPMEE